MSPPTPTKWSSLPLILALFLVLGFARAQPCPRAITFATNYQYRGRLHFICLQAQPDNNLVPRLEVFDYLFPRPIFSREVGELDTNQLATFVDDEGSLRILLAVPNRFNGTSMYSLDRNGAPIEETHTINTQFVSAMSIWRLALNWEWHLVIANQPDYTPFVGYQAPPLDPSSRRPPPEPQPMLTMHSWRSTYFDAYQTVQLHPDSLVNKIEPMYINGQEFIVVATESSGLERARPGPDSPIFKLSFADGNLNWVHYQDLKTRRALDVRSFAISHRNSLQQDYYIAVLGQLRPINDRPSQYRLANDSDQAPEDEHTLVMYKYFGDQFMLVDTIPALSANKLDAITYGEGDSYVIIALLSQHNGQINLYLFDGLGLRLMNSPYAGINRLPSAGRHRRTMRPPIVHLFHAPSPKGGADPNDTTIKRTLGEETQPLMVPTLAFSSSSPIEPADYGGGDQIVSPNSVYQIPVENAIKDEQSQNNYNKRSSVADDSLGWCKAMIGSLLADSFEMLSQKASTLPRINQRRPIELNGDLIIEDDLHVSDLLHVSRVLERVHFGGFHNDSPVYDPQSFDHSETFEAIRRAHLEIDELKNEVDQILVDDGSEQDLFRPVAFDTLVIECLNPPNMDPRFPMRQFVCPHIDEIQTENLNKRRISDIRSRAYLTGRSTTIDRDVRFEHLILRGKVKILGTLNGLLINDIVFKVGPSPGPIEGRKFFKNAVLSSSNLIVNSWNGNSINRQSVLVSSGEQRIETNLAFEHVIIDSSQAMPNMSSRIEKLNELHLDTHLGQRAVASEDNHFEVPIEFDELTLNGPVRFTEGSRLSSVELMSLWANTMFKQANQNVTAPMELMGDVHVSYGGDIFVDGPVNGEPFRPYDFVMKNLNTTILNPVVFDDVNFHHLHIEANRTLNGIQVSVNPATGHQELAILYNTGDQIITADKTLDEIRLGGSSNITGLINGLNLNQLYELTTNGQPFKFNDIRLTGQNIQLAETASFHVDTINNFQAHDICSLANRVSNYTRSYYDKLKFDQPPRFRSLRCGTINGFHNLSNYFLTRTGNQHVAGSLRLLNGAIFNTSINILSTFNGLNIGPLSNAIARAISENRTGSKDVWGDLVIDHLFAERINDLRLSSVFLARADNPQIVRASLTFDHLDIESILTVRRDLRTNSFNGLNITDLVTNTLQYDTPQTIYNHVELVNLQLLPGSSLITPSVNMQNLRHLYNDAVLVDVPQQIMAPKTFRSPIDFENRLQIRHGLDGLTDEELRFNLLLQSDDLIEGDLEFNNDIFVRKELEVQSGIINDIDINLFVSSMLYENRPGQTGLRILGNGSIRFKDVDVKNLVVGGTIQGVDLSKEAILTSDNINGTYQPNLLEKQNMLNNLRLLNNGYGPGATFWVKTNYSGQPLIGTCYVQSCPRTTVQPPLTGSVYPQPYTSQTPAPLPVPIFVPRVPESMARPLEQTSIPRPWEQTLIPRPLEQTFIPRPLVTTPLFNQSMGMLLVPQQPQQPVPTMPPTVYGINQGPVRYYQQFYPTVLPQPFGFINTSVIKTVWTPNWNVINAPTYVDNQIPNQIVPINAPAYVNTDHLEHISRFQAQAISELSLRINRYLSITFYYETLQRHPDLGPLLHAPSNPIVSEEGSSLLLLKGTGKPGEPCLQTNQSVAVMAQQRIRNPMAGFTLSSSIQGTSNPSIVDSAVVGSDHYLFILDTQYENPMLGYGLMSRVLIHSWNKAMGFYELRQQIPIDGFPTAMKAFVVNSVVCIALANRRLKLNYNAGAEPILHCQQVPGAKFDVSITIPAENVFDLDVVVQPRSTRVMIAMLSQVRSTEQIGNLFVGLYEHTSGLMEPLMSRYIAKPLKLHFVGKNALAAAHPQLVVTEAITSNDGAEATTRIFSMRSLPGSMDQFGAPGSIQVYESQLIRDNEFYDIQSVLLYEKSSLLFLRSAHSISIYAPLDSGQRFDCDTEYRLAQKVPTKGANKFLVFNDYLSRNHTNIRGLLSHFLVLSKDDCAQQQYSTLILKPRFK